MRRAIIAVILVLTLVSVTSTSVYAPLTISSPNTNLDYNPMDAKFTAEFENFGSNVPVVQYMDRLISDQILSISNSYALTDTHSNSIDLSSYQIPGWTLYKVIIDSKNMTAIDEREVVGTSLSPVGGTYPYPYAIFEHDIDLYYDQLAQGFYNMSHDGKLQNISILYDSPQYDPGNQNYAYIDVRSNYQDGSTNMVSSVQLADVDLTTTWANVTEPAILDAITTYYVVLNGTKLVEDSGFYPVIRWWFQDSTETFLTRRHNTDGDSWGSDRPYEALLNYTYVPWNKTSSSALVYSDSSAVNLMLNGTPVSGNSWAISSATNITSLQISTNQSVNVFHNLTLCYTQDILASTVWKANLSGAPIMWNVTTDLVYPAVPNIIARSMNITNIPIDWNSTGLYLGASPGGSQSKNGSVVVCSGLSDGTWTLTSTAPNYATDLALYDSSDSSPIIYKVANNVTMDINATIEDGLSTPMNEGTTNLSILHAGALTHSFVEMTVIDGAVGFQWDISSTTTGNGTHSVEVYWISTDGLEAGYITQDVFVFHATTLAADEYSITAYTENSFNIGINFDSRWPGAGLGAPAVVTYSFESMGNSSLIYEGGGRWTANVDTIGVSSGAFILTVYAEGFALENQSLTIDVELTIETEPLEINWAPSNDITFLESTNLTVAYRNGSTPIPGAIVNVTFDATTYDLKWDAISEFYWIQLNGTDFVTVPGTTVLTINAWKSGYTSQYNDTASITINEEPTGTSLVVTWDPANRNITYIETITIYASYTFNSNPITNSSYVASVNVTFIGYDLVNMEYNATSELWEVTLDGSDYLGVTSVTIRAAATGYGSDASTPEDLIVVEDIPMLTNSWTDSSASIDYATNILLLVNVTDSSGAFINNATLTV